MRAGLDCCRAMFEKNLHDLVRGIRTNKTNEAKFIAACIEEIRNEIKTVSFLKFLVMI